MKATFVTLIGLLATSVAATPLHPHVGVSIVARGDAKEGGDAKQGSDAKQGGDAKKNDKNKQADKAAGKADKAGASGADKAVGGAGKAGAGAANNATAGAGGAAAGGDSKAGALVLPDGRIKKDAKPEDFNVLASVFKSAVVKGDGK